MLLSKLILQYIKKLKIIEKKLRSIIRSILFYGQHDIAITGNIVDKDNFVDLLKFWVDSSDNILLKNFDITKYVSHRIQNDIIQVCGQVIRNNIIS
jgi:hypothetical protein